MSNSNSFLIENDDIIGLSNSLNRITTNNKISDKYNSEFNHDKNYLNVIRNIIPVNINYAHFDNNKFPEELYKVQFINGNIEELNASEINQYALGTHKYIHLHNITLINPKYTKGFIYGRCSRKNDVSIETQRKICFEYAMKEGIQLYPFGYSYDNNVSARNMKNMNYEFGYWSEYLEENSHLIIYSIDRLSRNLLKGLQFLELMAKKNITVHFVTNEIKYTNKISSMQKMMVQYELLHAEQFSNQLSEKTKISMKRLRDEGNQYGRATYGYSFNIINGIRKKVLNTSEQINILKIRNKYTDICNNKHKYIEEGHINNTKISMLKYLSKWIYNEGILNRGNKMTLYCIKNIIKNYP